MVDKVEVTKEVIQEFLAEADEIIENINNDLMSISSAENIDDADPDLLNNIFRGAHSLKGLAGMFGFTGISHLSHRLEDILDTIRLGKLDLTQDILDILFEGMDFLTALIKTVSSGTEPATSDEIEAFIESFTKKLAGDDADKKNEPAKKDKQFYIDARILNVLTEYEEHRLEENKKKKKNIFLLHSVFKLETFDEELSSLTTAVKPLGEVISILPSSGEAAEGNIEFDVLFGTNKELSEVDAVSPDNVLKIDLSVKPGAVTEVSPEPLKEVARDPEAVRAVKPAKKTTIRETIKSISSTVRVDISRLDSLMNTVGELVLSKAIIGEITDRLKEREGFTGIAIELYKANRTLGRKLDELQNSVMGVRMIPLSQVFEKLTRVVRKLSRESGKEVELRIYGGDTELDKLIVEELGDPLMHIIRNSIDHGLETPDVREAAGKPPKGMITLRASQKGNYVVIEVEDDGRGINKEKVKEKAVEKKIIDEGDELSEKDIYNLLLMAGFSTKDTVSETSGRGVGMDVVKANITKMSGMIDIMSEDGKGTSIVLTLPITLAIIQALIIQLIDKLYAIPLNSVSEIIKIVPDQIKTIEKKEVMQLRDETLPLLRLKEMFELKGEVAESEKLYVVVVGFGLKKVGIIVDALRGQQDIVIKSIGDTFKKIKGIAGATDLGNQKTILVLDVGTLIEEALY